jgi:hypothetical protein
MVILQLTVYEDSAASLQHLLYGYSRVVYASDRSHKQSTMVIMFVVLVHVVVVYYTAQQARSLNF